MHGCNESPNGRTQEKTQFRGDSGKSEERTVFSEWLLCPWALRRAELRRLKPSKILF